MSRSYWLSAIAAGLVIALGALAQDASGPQNRPANSQEQKQTNESKPGGKGAIKAQQSAPVIAPSPPRREQSDQAAKAEQKGDPVSKFTWVDTGAQWVMAIAGMLAIVIAGFTLELLRRTLLATQSAAVYAKQAAEAARDAVIEAEKTTAAANRSADDSKRIGEAQVRAYVQIEEVKVHLEAHAYHPMIMVKAKNFGQSPARRFVWRPTIEYLCEPIDPGMEPPLFPLQRRSQPFVEVNPDAMGKVISATKEIDEVTSVPRMAPTEPEMRHAHAGKLVIWITVQFHYVDIFNSGWTDRRLFSGRLRRMGQDFHATLVPLPDQDHSQSHQ